MNFFKKFFYFFSASLLIFLFFSNNFATAFNFVEDSGLSDFALEAGHISEDKALETDPGGAITMQIGMAIQVILSFIGVLFMVLIIYGGFLWMTAHGNDQQVEKAKKVISQSIIGLFVVVSAYAVSIFIITSFNF